MTRLTSLERDGLAGLGAGTGLWTAREAQAVLGRHRARQLVVNGTWREVWPGVLGDVGIDDDRGRALRATSLAAGPGGVVYGRSAARWWGLPLVDDDDPATERVEHLLHDVAVRARRVVRTMPDGRVLRPRRLDLAPRDVVVVLARKTVPGVRVTTVLRTLWDLAALILHEALVCAMDHALQRRLVTVAQLRGLVLARAGLQGAPAYARAVARADGRSESVLETLGRLVLRPVIPTLVPQVRWRRDGRVVARFDLGDDAARFAVEADGKSVHGRPEAVAGDRKRVDRLGGEWSLSRYTWWDVRVDTDAFVARTVREHQRAVRRRARDTGR